ncbi:DDB1- and CUL4-associated factor 10 homolog [Pollicipes pollicipes]|uniref:DDB1- and CUL4-associated factor 10 homolog n=1 Tax=Pollicipes pollicipes TaxID=41117 RepID=UPI001885668B|nr:DDB1- and CUL4-associated factor 10 homolog [Pollicipes pollicipes]
MPKQPRDSGRVTFYPYDRQYGWRPSIGDQDALSSQLYSGISPVATYDDAQGGAVFNLEFSEDGKVLAAACERRCVLLFDTLTRRIVHTVENAHQGFVNCVKFLDCRMFASCSDDKTVAIWDVRNLRQKVHCLEAHANWVKNIEYLPHKSLLVTSGFDSSIYTWNLNNIGGCEQRAQHTRVLHASGLMRISLTPDFSKLVICTNNGYLMVVHDVDFDTMQEDLRGFKPSLYKLMQISKTPFPAAARYTHLFDLGRRRNRIEFITDFPEGNEADMIASLAMHPLSWCVASRNTSGDDATEWTCVHDIQDEHLPPAALDPDASHDPPEQEPAPEALAGRSIELRAPSADMVEALEIIPPDDDADAQGPFIIRAGPSRLGGGAESVLLIGSQASARERYRHVDFGHRIAQNVPRLARFIEEPNLQLTHGYIKELCFSADGRLLCSPFGYGVRLLAFSEAGQELSACAAGGPRRLHELAATTSHRCAVVSARFSPVECLLVTGCLGGGVVWHQPRLAS